MECLRRRSVDGSTCKGTNEPGSEENGKDAEVLGGVVHGNTFVTRTEGVLNERAEVVRQWHVLGRYMSASDRNEGAESAASWGFGRGVSKVLARSPHPIPLDDRDEIWE